MCVGLVLARLGFLCVFCAASNGFALASRKMTLVLCAMVRVKRRVGTVLFVPRKFAARLSECVAVVEVARLEQTKSCKLQEKQQLEGLG